MKKLMFSAVALCAAVGFADITSQNVVGYNTTSLSTGKSKYSMIGGSFSSVSGTGFQMNGDMTISNIKGGTNGVTDSDTLLMWDPTQAGGAGGYITFYYYDDGSEKGWCDPVTDDWIENSDAYKNGLPVGIGLWFNPLNANSRTIQFKKPF